MSEVQGCPATSNSRKIIFHGTGKEYFLVLIVNLLLVIITLGIFIPWAIVRSKRYLYGNTELSGFRLSYGMTGISILISWVCLLIYIFAIEAAFLRDNSSLALCLIAPLVLFFPYLIVLSLRYQMQSTSINGVRFNFQSSGLKMWWAIIGCPLLMSGLVIFSCAAISSIILSFVHFELPGIMITFSVSFIISIMGFGVVQGTTVGLWLNLFFNGLSFGTQKFASQVSIKQCIFICFKGMLVLIPFLIIAMALLSPDLLKLFSIATTGNNEDVVNSEAMKSLQNSISLCYVIYCIGAFICYCYLRVTLRNYYFNTVVLSEKIAFRSTVTLMSYMTQFMINILITVCTLGVGYPWARVRYCQYMANNTWVDGELDSLDLQDHDDKIATDIVSRLSRGLVTNMSL